MIILTIVVVEHGNSNMIPVNPFELIETTLTITPTSTSIPTLISVENIVKRINDVGLELSSADELLKIAGLVNNEYISRPTHEWVDQKIILHVNRRSLPRESYMEFDRMRGVVTQAAHTIAQAEACGDEQLVQACRQHTKHELQSIVKEKPSWWQEHGGEILKFAVTGMVGLLISSVIGLPLNHFIGALLA